MCHQHLWILYPYLHKFVVVFFIDDILVYVRNRKKHEEDVRIIQKH